LREKLRPASRRWGGAPILLLFVLSSSLFSQVKTYPYYYVSQRATYGIYREAAQKQIYHLATEFSLVPSWDSSFTFLYRQSGIDYTSGSSYKQSQFIGSYSRIFPARRSFIWSRFDVSFVDSNSILTNKNLTLYAETGFQDAAGRGGMGFSGFYSNYTDVNSFGASAFAWISFGNRSVLSSKFNINAFSGEYHNQKRFYSGRVSLYLPSSGKVAFLFSGFMGKRSLFYDSDIKLIYNLTDTHLASAAVTIYFYASRSLTIFLDGTLERYEAYAGGRYRVFYLTLYGSIRI